MSEQGGWEDSWIGGTVLGSVKELLTTNRERISDYFVFFSWRNCSLWACPQPSWKRACLVRTGCNFSWIRPKVWSEVLRLRPREEFYGLKLAVFARGERARYLSDYRTSCMAKRQRIRKL